MVFSRFKVVKDLLLAKLDTILSRLEAIDGTIKTIHTKTDRTTAIVKATTEDNTSLLEAAIYGIEQQQLLKQQGVEQQEQLKQQIAEISGQLQVGADISADQGTVLQTLSATLEVLSTQVESIYQAQEKTAQGLQAITKQRRVVAKTEKSVFINPEIGLMTYLYSYLPSRVALDVGANVGEISESLLKCGYEVYAFEPYLPVFEKLQTSLRHYPEFHALNLAIGSEDKTMQLHIASDLSETAKHGNPSRFNSLVPHAMLEDLKFADSIQVQVRSLASLHQSSEIPAQIGLVKIDTEGFDIEVIQGMADHKYPVLITEFWDTKHAFAQSPNVQNRLEDLVSKMKQRQYHWYIVIHRSGLYDAAFYCNYPESIDFSWGNIFFFQSYEIFGQALKWCSAVLPETYFEN